MPPIHAPDRPLRAPERIAPALGRPFAAPSPLARAPLARAPLMRKVEILWLTAQGGIGEAARIVPALSAFEEAFAAFARGTLFPTARGLIAVEDLWPGLELRVAGGVMKPLLWRGSTMLVPPSGGRADPAMSRLTRIGADALGIARPIQDLVLGPHARLVRRGPAVRALTGGEAALVPAADHADGGDIVAVTPASPVQVFHLGLDRHERLQPHGVEVESQHPGPQGALGLPPEMLALWIACFPHRKELADWGPMALPRLSGQDIDLHDAA